MKKGLLVFISVVLLTAGTFAAPVSVEKAHQVAANFFNRQFGVGYGMELQENTSSLDIPNIYLFTMPNSEGFVIVSADDCLRPILGYSQNNAWADKTPDNVAAWLRQYSDLIAQAREQGATPDEATTQEWESLLDAENSEPPYEQLVAPMVQTQWNQNPFYNDSCPYNSIDNFRCVTGCVATATAQIMKFHNHPTRGIGSHSYNTTSYGTLSANFNTAYDWTNMPAKLTTASDSIQIAAVAQLMYHVGVSVDMDYGRSSGAVTTSYGSLDQVSAERSLHTYFGYSPSINSIYRDGIHDSVWLRIIHQELNAGRPILYSGRDPSGGHAFICDGIDSTGMLHFNWGWGGYCDGFYPYTALNPAAGGAGGNATYTFNLRQAAIINIYPDTATNTTCTITVIPSNNNYGSVSGTTTVSRGDTITISATAVDGYRFSHWDDGNMYNPRDIIATENATYKAVITPVKGDTLQYDHGNRSHYGSYKYWGAKFVPQSLSGYRTIKSVYAYLYAGRYIAHIYNSTSVSSSTEIGTQTYTVTGSLDWRTLEFTNPITIDTTLPVWIIMEKDSVGVSNWANMDDINPGTTNGNYYSSNGTTFRLTDKTFMVRGILYNPPVYYDINIAANNSRRGSVSGAGRYIADTIITLAASPYSCYSFTRWSDGNTENPRSLRVTSDTNLTAIFDSIIYQTTVLDTACDQYTWIDGNTYTSSADNISTTLRSMAGCDSVVTLGLTIHNSYYDTTNTTACTQYVWNGTTYDTTGIYTIASRNTFGCDSINVLNLVVNGTITTNISVSACDSYTFEGNTYTASGEYTFNHTGSNNCDSVVVLHLTINRSYSDTLTIANCGAYLWHDSTYAISGTYSYQDTTNVGCDSNGVLYLTIHPTYSDTTSLLACSSYTWHDSTYTNSGIYAFSGTTINGCDSINYLDLTIDLPGNDTTYASACIKYVWFGDTLTHSGEYLHIDTSATGCNDTSFLMLTIFEEFRDTTIIETCEAYTWHGNTYLLSGIYTDSASTVNGCDSLTSLNLTLHPVYSDHLYDTACLSYTWFGDTHNTSGMYVHTDTSVFGCDSTHLLYLTITEPHNDTLMATSCGSYTWHDSTYTSSGIYIFTTQRDAVCDDTTFLMLTILPVYNDTTVVSACGSYLWNDSTYNNSGIYSLAGTSTKGCDSTSNIALTIHPNYLVEDTVIACTNYTWNGTEYDSTGVYTVSDTSIYGCDSTLVLNLTITTSHNDTTVVTACGTYLWNDITYTQSGEYFIVDTTAYGCNDTSFLLLTLLQTYNDTIDVEACEIYSWNGTVYLMGGTYTSRNTSMEGCDSITTLNLTLHYGSSQFTIDTACLTYQWQGNTYNESGIFIKTDSTIYGCDSTMVLLLNIEHPTHDTISVVACGEYQWMDSTYAISGFYTNIDSTSSVCTNTNMLDLTILPTYKDTTTVTACLSYLWHDSTYTNSGIYEYRDTTTMGCDSISYLNLTIMQPVVDTLVVSACGSYAYQGTTYDTTGVYVITTSVAYGCDSTTILVLTISHPTTDTTNIVACGSYLWNDSTYTTSGIYTKLIANDNGCADTMVLNLTIMPLYADTMSVAICDSYSWFDSTYTVSGIYTHHDTTLTGCDSNHVLALTIHPSYNTIDTITAVDSYTWIDDSTYTNSGVYYHHDTTLYGCDSNATLVLTIIPMQPFTITVLPADSTMGTVSGGGVYMAGDTITITATAMPCFTFSNFNGTATTNPMQLVVLSDTTIIANFMAGDVEITDNIVACDHYVWIDGEYYTESTNTPTRRIHSSFGCDSILHLNLTILPAYIDTIEVTACNTYSWFDTEYDRSGRYSHTDTTVDGCDSSSILLLTLHYADTKVIEALACESYIWHDSTYTESGSYIFHYDDTTNDVCGSIETLRLTIAHPIIDTIIDAACGTYQWHDIDFTTDTLVTITNSTEAGCTDSHTLSLTIYPIHNVEDSVSSIEHYTWIDGNDYTESGTYTYTTTDINGCDSTVVLQLTITPNTEGIDGIEAMHLNIYPNPTTSVVNIDADNVAKIEVYDAYGRRIAVSEENMQVDLTNMTSGTYMLRITLQDGRSANYKVVKR